MANILVGNKKTLKLGAYTRMMFILCFISMHQFVEIYLRRIYTQTHRHDNTTILSFLKYKETTQKLHFSSIFIAIIRPNQNALTNVLSDADILMFCLYSHLINSNPY